MYQQECWVHRTVLMLFVANFEMQVLPVLFAVLHVCDEPLRELLLEQLVVLVVVVRQHIRRFLPDLLGILGEFWGRSSKIQHVCLQVIRSFISLGINAVCPAECA
jgi:FKBP12-rapamycin complex-associated protein